MITTDRRSNRLGPGDFIEFPANFLLLPGRFSPPHYTHYATAIWGRIRGADFTRAVLSPHHGFRPKVRTLISPVFARLPDDG
jgi:hypothetical protein